MALSAPASKKAVDRSVLIGVLCAVVVSVLAFGAGHFMGKKEALKDASANKPASGGVVGFTSNGEAEAVAPQNIAVHLSGVIMGKTKDSLTVILPDNPTPEGDTSVIDLVITSETVFVARVRAVENVSKAASDAGTPDTAPPATQDGAQMFKDLSITIDDLIKLDLIDFEAQQIGNQLYAQKVIWIAHVVREPKQNEIPELDTSNRFDGQGKKELPPAPEGSDNTAEAPPAPPTKEPGELPPPPPPLPSPTETPPAADQP